MPAEEGQGLVAESDEMDMFLQPVGVDKDGAPEQVVELGDVKDEGKQGC